MDGRDSGQHENVSVPEHVAGIGGSGQSAGADGGLAHVTACRVQVEQCEAGSELDLRVAHDRDSRVVPTVRPCSSMPSEQALETFLRRRGKPGDRLLNFGCPLPVR